MRPKYIFSSRHTARAKLGKSDSKPKFPELIGRLIGESDIILEVLDARFPEEMRNRKIERYLKLNKKRLIYVLNKADLVNIGEVRRKLRIFKYVFVSCKNRKGKRELIERINIDAKKVKTEDRIKVGVIGYPNTGKSSLINYLTGKKRAKTGKQPGFTKGIQKIKLTDDILLIDSPGVITEDKYSSVKDRKISQHAKLGARSYSNVKNPENVVFQLLEESPKEFEKFYGVSAENPDSFIEELGKKSHFLKKHAEVDRDRTARMILRHWQEGKIILK